MMDFNLMKKEDFMYFCIFIKPKVIFCIFFIND